MGTSIRSQTFLLKSRDLTTNLQRLERNNSKEQKPVWVLLNPSINYNKLWKKRPKRLNGYSTSSINIEKANYKRIRLPIKMSRCSVTTKKTWGQTQTTLNWLLSYRRCKTSGIKVAKDYNSTMIKTNLSLNCSWISKRLFLIHTSALTSKSNHRNRLTDK